MIIETIMLDKIIPSAGLPGLLIFPNIAGNNLSLAAASGICPWTRIQPLSAPKVETTAPRAREYSCFNYNSELRL